MKSLKPTLWHENNTIVSTWFERDRAMVRLTDTRDQEIICLFDNAVQEFIDDGFKNDRISWHTALSRYATEHKLIAEES